MNTSPIEGLRVVRDGAQYKVFSEAPGWTPCSVPAALLVSVRAQEDDDLLVALESRGLARGQIPALSDEQLAAWLALD